ncbi:MAG: transcriptional regulator [Paenibacillus sp.]|jgi:AraC-like DNA-binding protein/ABC-type Fe3+-citrate transport system substrate-binding protein|nr:transcriptional regulator [Paenibacillus sp.]
MNYRGSGTKHTPLLMLSSVHKRHHIGSSTIHIPSLETSLMFYVIQGKGELQIDHTLYPLKPHQLYWGVPGMNIKLTSLSGGLDYYLLFVDPVGLSREGGVWKVSNHPYSAYLPLVPGRIGLKSTTQTGERMDQLFKSFRARTSTLFDLNGQFQQLLYTMSQDITEELGDEEDMYQGIEKSTDYMHTHFQDKIKLETLAEIAGFTLTSYSREFKKVKGISPIDYLNAYRIAQAKQLLLNRSLSIREVSSSSGFVSEFYFSRMFKREVGISPTLYMKRKNIRVAIAAGIPLQDNLHSLGVETVFSAKYRKSKTMNEELYNALLVQQLEQMRQAEPELIIADSYHSPYLEQLQQIAPTVKLDYCLDWRSLHKQIAGIVGREREAEQNFKLMEQKENKARALLAHRYENDTIAVVGILHKLIRIYGTSSHPLNDLIYNGLGLKPAHCVPWNQMRVEFSTEEYPYLDCDHLFILKFFYPGDELLFKSIQLTPEWRSIKAVKSNRTRLVPNWVGMSWSPYGREQIIEELLGLS